MRYDFVAQHRLLALLPNCPINRLAHRLDVGRQLQWWVGVAGDHIRQRFLVVTMVSHGENKCSVELKRIS